MSNLLRWCEKLHMRLTCMYTIDVALSEGAAVRFEVELGGRSRECDGGIGGSPESADGFANGDCDIDDAADDGSS